MSGKNVSLTALQARKHMLLVESELNRAQMLSELDAFKDEVVYLKDQVQAISSVASSAAKMAATVSAIGGVFTHRDGDGKKKSSWISTLFSGARVGASLWTALRHKK